MARKQADEQAQGFSPWDDAANDGGGEQTATLTEVNFVQEFTYGGRYKDNPSAALHTVYEIAGMQKPWDENWPIGPSEKFDVSRDGYSIKALGKNGGLSRKSSGYFFFNALEVALKAQGLDRDDYVTLNDDGSISVKNLEGLEVVLINKLFTQVSGDTKEKKVIGSIVLDDAPKGRGARPSSTASTGSTSRSNGNGAGKIEAKTAAAIRELLDEKTSVKAADLANYVFQGNRKDPDAKAMMNLCFKDSFLAGLDGIELKKGVLRLAEED